MPASVHSIRRYDLSVGAAECLRVNESQLVGTALATFTTALKYECLGSETASHGYTQASNDLRRCLQETHPSHYSGTET